MLPNGMNWTLMWLLQIVSIKWEHNYEPESKTYSVRSWYRWFTVQCLLIYLNPSWDRSLEESNLPFLRQTTLMESVDKVDCLLIGFRLGTGLTGLGIQYSLQLWCGIPSLLLLCKMKRQRFDMQEERSGRRRRSRRRVDWLTARSRVGETAGETLK